MLFVNMVMKLSTHYLDAKFISALGASKGSEFDFKKMKMLTFVLDGVSHDLYNFPMF
jgi:hypothetical protein